MTLASVVRLALWHRAVVRTRAFISGSALCCLFTFFSSTTTASGTTSKKLQFDLPAGEARPMLRRFANQAKRELVFPVDNVAGIATNAVHGEFTPQEAIGRMLAGTGLVASFDKRTGAIAVRKGTLADGKAAPNTAEPPATERRDQSPKKNEHRIPQPPQSMKKSKLLTKLIPIFALSLSPTDAQIAPASTNADNQRAEEKAIELSPFEVTTDQDVGYLAANSLAGSRLNSSLKDIAASISVFTEEFIADIGAVSFEEAALYANNLQFSYGEQNTAPVPNMNSSMDSFQNFRVRGLPTTLARNYFEWGIPTDTFNVGRIEDSRGPNSVLFGIAQAGGLINTVTKQPMPGRSFMKAAVLYGSYDSYRGTVDVNQVAINGKLAARFNAVYDKTNSYRYHAFNNNRRVHLGLKYSPTSRTSVRAEYEGGIIRANLVRPFGPTNAFLTWHNAGRPLVDTPSQAATGTVSIGNAVRVTYISNDDRLLNLQGTRITNGNLAIVMDEEMTDRSINVSGPGTTRFANYDTVSAFLEHRFGQKSFLELAYNYQYYKNDSKFITQGAHDMLGDPNKFLPNGQPNPHAGQLFMDGIWARFVTAEKANSIRSIYTTQFDAGKWGDYRLVGLGEYRDHRFQLQGLGQFWDGAPFNTTPENVANAVFFRNYVTERDWSTYHVGVDNAPFVSMTDPITGRTLSSVWINRLAGQLRDVPTTTRSLMLGTQARYFDGRLVASLGWREDRADSLERPSATTRDPATNRLVVNYDGAIDTSFTGRTKTLGLVGHLTKNISVLGNYATNLGLPSAVARIIGGQMAPPREGVGKDIGLAVTLFGGKVYGRAIYYETAATNLAQNVVAMDTSNEAVLATAVNNNLITPAEAAARSLGQLTSLRKDQASSGYEFQLTGNLTSKWRITTNFSINDISDSNVDPELKAWFTDNFAFWATLPQDLVAVGSNMTIAQHLNNRRNQMDEIYNMEGKTGFGNRRYKGNIFTRYAFDSGALKGLSAGGGFFSQSKIVVGNSGLGTDNFAYRYGNSFWRADAMLGYDVRGLPRKIKLRLQLNVTNVFDNLDPQILRYQTAAGDEIRRMVQPPPREWRFTANLDF